MHALVRDGKQGGQFMFWLSEILDGCSGSQESIYDDWLLSVSLFSLVNVVLFLSVVFVRNECAVGTFVLYAHFLVSPQNDLLAVFH